MYVYIDLVLCQHLNFSAIYVYCLSVHRGEHGKGDRRAEGQVALSNICFLSWNYNDTGGRSYLNRALQVVSSQQS